MSHNNSLLHTGKQEASAAGGFKNQQSTDFLKKFVFLSDKALLHQVEK
jgi:hypothetical protein